jgi:PPOX class probable F420-dependent enzyme
MPSEIDEKHAGLLRSKNLAAVTVVRPDGSPHTTPTWVDYDGQHVLVNTAYGRAKARYLEQNPVASVLVVDEQNPYLWVSVSGRAELTQDGAREHINQLSHRYNGQDYDMDEEHARQRVIVKLRPERVTTSG